MTVTKEETAPKKDKTFLAKLKSTCEKCTPNSILVYFRATKRLYRLLEKEGDIPLTGAWLQKNSLKEKFKKLPLNQRRNLSSAAVKACKAYKINADAWSVLMYKDASAYERKRSKNKRTDKEKEKWPKGGILAVRKASREMWKRVKFLLKEKPNLKNFYQYQLFILLKLFSEIPFRNLFPTFQLTKNDGNYIHQKKKGNWEFVVNKHKTAKRQGQVVVPISRAGSMALRKFIRYRNQVEEIKHNFLLSNKTGGPLSKSAMGKALHRITKILTGRGFGSRLIRILASTALKTEIDKVSKLSNTLLHAPGSKETKNYTRKL